MNGGFTYSQKQIYNKLKSGTNLIILHMRSWSSSGDKHMSDTYFLSIIKFHLLVWFGFMVSNATFNNISAISWRSVLLEETGVPGEKH